MQAAYYMDEIAHGGTGDDKSNASSQLKPTELEEKNSSLHTVPIKLVSATYGPCDGRRLINGERCSTEAARIPNTRDVLPFLRALLLQAQTVQQEQTRGACIEDVSEKNSNNVNFLMMENQKQEDMNSMISIANNSNQSSTSNVTHSSTTELRSRVSVPLIMEGKSMNAVFGDPCPGTTKILRIQYYFDENYDGKEEGHKKKFTRKGQELCRATFFEHEEVVLKRKKFLFQNDVKVFEGEIQDNEVGESKRINASDNSVIQPIETSSFYRSQSIRDFKLKQQEKDSKMINHKIISYEKWRLRSGVSEIVLPLVLPYLPLLQRAQCQLVCKVWRYIVHEWGIAQVVDVNRCQANMNTLISNKSHQEPHVANTNNETTKINTIQPQNTIRSFLRGIISTSYSSLQSLFLNDYHQLTRDDFHPLIPRLKKLKSLDISRCKQLNNYTLILISQHLHTTLEMLYMKGLPNASDVGVKAVAIACKKLRVLEISNLKITDTSAFAIGNNLLHLQALYMRDNWKLTSEGINCITTNCRNLTQLTLWGTIKLKTMEKLSNMKGLVLLNLYGCHGLNDNCIANFKGLNLLRSLIVSECHGLTDHFVVQLAHILPNINHLHLRYLRHLTDTSLEAISANMKALYSLDLSFCSKLTATGLSNLLNLLAIRGLTELRLYNCSQLDLRGIYKLADSLEDKVVDGEVKRSTLSLLDVRKGRATGGNNLFNSNESVIVDGGRRVVYNDIRKKMKRMKFEEKLQGFLLRPTKWNNEMRERFIENMAR